MNEEINSVDIQEKLLEGIDYLVQKRIEGISFDRTIVAKVEDSSFKAEGRYILSNESHARFDAYTSDTSYSNGSSVYVMIPEGNWDNKKLIIGKYIADDTVPYTFVSPMDTVIPLTPNIVASLTPNDGYKLVANKTRSEGEERNYSDDVLVVNLESYTAGYNRLGISANFLTQLANAVVGSYGIEINLYKENEEHPGDANFATPCGTAYLDSKDMYGNVYNFNIWSKQEKVFDISDCGRLMKLEIKFYQNNDFKDIKGEFLDYKDHNGVEMPHLPNIWINSLDIIMGLDIEGFDGDKVILWTIDGMTYSADKEDSQKKTVNISWVHRYETGTIGVVNNNSFTDKDDLEIRWYKYQLGAPAADEYSGIYWQLIDGEKERFFSKEINLEESTLLQTQDIKVIVLLDKNPIYSDIFTFKNENYALPEEVKSYVNDLTLDFLDGSNGIYDIYKLNNDIQDRNQAEQIRAISFRKSGEKIADGEETIVVKWHPPKDNSMIQEVEPPEEGWNKNLFYYKISNRYGPSKMNNKIGLDVTYRGIKYYTSKELFFGPAGTNGSKFTLVAGFADRSNAVLYEEGNKSEATPRAAIVETYLYDIEGNSVAPLNNYEYKFINGNITNNEEKINEFVLNAEQYIDKKFVLRSSGIKEEEKETLEADADTVEKVESKTDTIADADPVESDNEEVVSTEETDEEINYGYEIISECLNVYFDSDSKFSDFITAGKKINYLASAKKGDIIIYNNILGEKCYAICIKDSEYLYPDFVDGKIISSKTFDGKIEGIYRLFEEIELVDILKVVPYRDQDGKEVSDKRYIEQNADVINLKENYSILEIKAKAPDGRELTTYLPIPIKTSSEYLDIDGVACIAYSSDGTIEEYYKEPYQIRNNKFENVSDLEWKISCNRNEFSAYEANTPAPEGESNYYPKLEKVEIPASAEDEDPIVTYSLKPFPFYVKDSVNKVCVFAVDRNGNVQWSQPILISQQLYSVAEVNEWDGKLNFDEEKSSVKAATIIAGSKNLSNQFSGVMMGDLSKTDSELSLRRKTGLYGFNRGQQSFAFTEDGTGFIGIGGGRIVFDGTEQNGQIYSVNYHNKNGLNKGGSGALLDLKKGKLSLKKEGTEVVKLQSEKNDALLINTLDGNPLMRVGKDKYYLQSADYNKWGDDVTKVSKFEGTFFDLQNGKLYISDGKFSGGIDFSIDGDTTRNCTVYSWNSEIGGSNSTKAIDEKENIQMAQSAFLNILSSLSSTTAERKEDAIYSILACAMAMNEEYNEKATSYSIPQGVELYWNVGGKNEVLIDTIKKDLDSSTPTILTYHANGAKERGDIFKLSGKICVFNGEKSYYCIDKKTGATGLNESTKENEDSGVTDSTVTASSDNKYCFALFNSDDDLPNSSFYRLKYNSYGAERENVKRLFERLKSFNNINVYENFQKIVLAYAGISYSKNSPVEAGFADGFILEEKTPEVGKAYLAVDEKGEKTVIEFTKDTIKNGYKFYFVGDKIENYNSFIGGDGELNTSLFDNLVVNKTPMEKAAYLSSIGLKYEKDEKFSYNFSFESFMSFEDFKKELEGGIKLEKSNAQLGDIVVRDNKVYIQENLESTFDIFTNIKDGEISYSFINILKSSKEFRKVIDLYSTVKQLDSQMEYTIEKTLPGMGDTIVQNKKILDSLISENPSSKGSLLINPIHQYGAANILVNKEKVKVNGNFEISSIIPYNRNVIDGGLYIRDGIYNVDKNSEFTFPNSQKLVVGLRIDTNIGILTGKHIKMDGGIYSGNWSITQAGILDCKGFGSKFVDAMKNKMKPVISNMISDNNSKIQIPYSRVTGLDAHINSLIESKVNSLIDNSNSYLYRAIDRMITQIHNSLK